MTPTPPNSSKDLQDLTTPVQGPLRWETLLLPLAVFHMWSVPGCQCFGKPIGSALCSSVVLLLLLIRWNRCIHSQSWTCGSVVLTSAGGLLNCGNYPSHMHRYCSELAIARETATYPLHFGKDLRAGRRVGKFCRRNKGRLQGCPHWGLLAWGRANERQDWDVYLAVSGRSKVENRRIRIREAVS